MQKQINVICIKHMNYGITSNYKPFNNSYSMLLAQQFYTTTIKIKTDNYK